MKVNQKLRKAIRLGLSSALIVGGGAYSINAMSMPSFARQTGWSCATCHTAFPQLTPMGRMFKLLGYTTYNVQRQQKVEAKLGKNTALLLMRLSQFSVFVQANYMDVKNSAKASGGSPSGIEFPQAVSLFYAGEITPQVGTFFHVTRDSGTGQMVVDDSDVRWAHPWAVGRNGQNLVITGLTFNNSVTEPDIYNSMPNWGAPFMASDAVGNSEPGGNLLVGGLAAAGAPIAGAGGYLAYLWGQDRANWLYLEADAYNGNALNGTGATSPGGYSGLEGVPVGKMDGTAPYLRVAYQRDWGNWNAELGAYWMTAKIWQTATNSGAENKYTDTVLQTQIQWLDTLNNNNLTILGNYFHEHQEFAGITGHQNETKINATYWYHDMYGAQAGYVDVTATKNTNADNPQQTGYWLQGSYQPWYNMRLSVRYTGYNKFLDTTNNASDANTWSLMSWFAF